MVQTVWKRALESVPCRTLLRDALALARRLRHSAYDCFYLALAVRLEAPLVTADRRLVELAAGEPALRGRVRPLAAY